jgi:DNA invertase Pin-like site-specific DNA recombinase
MDAAMSGSISDRPGWQDLLREAEKNGFDAIVVVKTDRITRSLKYAIQFYDWLMAHPTIKLVSIYDSVDLQTPDGYFTFIFRA